MDSIIALKGKDFIIIAADTNNAYSVLRMKVTLVTPRTSTIKYGISMDRNYLLLEASTQMYLSLETTSKKTQPSCSIKMDINCQLMTPLNSLDQSWQKLSEKGHIQLTVFQLDLKETNQDSTGLTISGQSLKPTEQHTAMRSIQYQVSWILFKSKTLLKSKDYRQLVIA